MGVESILTTSICGRCHYNCPRFRWESQGSGTLSHPSSQVGQVAEGRLPWRPGSQHTEQPWKAGVQGYPVPAPGDSIKLFLFWKKNKDSFYFPPKYFCFLYWALGQSKGLFLTMSLGLPGYGEEWWGGQGGMLGLANLPTLGLQPVKARLQPWWMWPGAGKWVSIL